MIGSENEESIYCTHMQNAYSTLQWVQSCNVCRFSLSYCLTRSFIRSAQKFSTQSIITYKIK